MQENSTNRFDLVSFVSSLNHQNEYFCRSHSHLNMEIVYTLSGIGTTHFSDNSAFSLTPGTVIIYWPEVKHDQAMEKLGDDVCVLLSVAGINWLPKNRKWLKINLENNSFLRKEILSLGNTPLRRTLPQQKSADLRSTALLIDLIALASEEESAEDANVKLPIQVVRAHDYIRDHFNTIFSVSDIADEVNISYDYLRHQFRDAYGISMKQYLLSIRIEYIMQFLTYSPLSLKRISQECGFDNIRYFSTCFKHHSGLTPGEYRKKYSEI